MSAHENQEAPVPGMSFHSVLGDDGLIKLDAQARTLRDRHPAVDEGRQISNQSPHEG